MRFYNRDNPMKPRGLSRRVTEYGDPEFSLFLRRTLATSLGFGREALQKPVVGIVNTYSEFNPCQRGIREIAEAVKRGVWQAGGLPLEFPTISLGEVFLHPTSMMLRNLMSLDVEVMLRAQPLDSAVLLGGCDKTVPALLMGAASADVPSVLEVAGPMLAGDFDGDRVGACTDCRRYWACYRRGEIDHKTIERLESCLVPTQGTCGVMGTASTMACLSEAMGVMLPGGASIPAVHSQRLQHAEETGKLAVSLKIPPRKILTAAALENALRVLLAIGGSTNAVIHLTAIAGRLGIRLDPARFNELSHSTPLLVNLKPTGQHYMEDFHLAGGVPEVLRQLKNLLHRNTLTVSGKRLGDLLSPPAARPQGVIGKLQDQGGLVFLRGSLAPDGAVLKRSAASPELMNRTGRAVVFTSLADLSRRIDDPNLEVRPDDFLVLQNAGPVAAGMPEAGYLPIPKKLKGVKDMVRISDARMSGTAFGTVVLHVSPEAAVGGPLGLVRDGDSIRLDVREQKLDLLVGAKELSSRHPPPSPKIPVRGYERLYRMSIQQANLGCDFDFLCAPNLRAGRSGTSR